MKPTQSKREIKKRRKRRMKVRITRDVSIKIPRFKLGVRDHTYFEVGLSWGDCENFSSIHHGMPLPLMLRELEMALNQQLLDALKGGKVFIITDY